MRFVLLGIKLLGVSRKYLLTARIPSESRWSYSKISFSPASFTSLKSIIDGGGSFRSIATIHLCIQGKKKVWPWRKIGVVIVQSCSQWERNIVHSGTKIM
jgi:hypothetical protein